MNDLVCYILTVLFCLFFTAIAVSLTMVHMLSLKRLIKLEIIILNNVTRSVPVN